MAGNDLGGRSDHYRQQQQQQQQQQLRRARPDALQSAPPPASSALSAPAAAPLRKETRLVSGAPAVCGRPCHASHPWPAGVDLQTFLPRSDAVFGDPMAAMLAPHDRCTCDFIV